MSMSIAQIKTLTVTMIVIVIVMMIATVMMIAIVMIMMNEMNRMFFPRNSKAPLSDSWSPGTDSQMLLIVITNFDIIIIAVI